MRPLPLRSASLFSALLIAQAAPARADEVNGLRCSVAPAGDVNGDGVPDFALAKRPRQLTASGGLVLDRVSVLSGKDGARIRTLLPSRRAHDFGRVVENVGDMDRDGVPELAVAGAQGVWVYSGRTGELVHDLGGPLAGLGVGSNLCGGQDVDGDGIPDLGVFRADQDADELRGIVVLYSGASGEVLCALDPAEESRWSSVGRVLRVPARWISPALAFLPDRDGDGSAEVALTVVAERGDSGEEAAELLVISPSSGEVLQRFGVPPRSQGFPWVLRSLPDVDGDGHVDLALSIIEDYGLVYSGGSGVELRRHSWVGGYLMAEGSSLDVMGDVDGDGVADYLLAANEDSLDCDPGGVTVYSGRNGKAVRSLGFEYGDAGMSNGITNCGAGADACALGDVDGDGITDVVVHIPRLRQVRILSGATFEELTRIDTRTLTQSASAPHEESGR